MSPLDEPEWFGDVCEHCGEELPKHRACDSDACAERRAHDEDADEVHAAETALDRAVAATCAPRPKPVISVAQARLDDVISAIEMAMDVAHASSFGTSKADRDKQLGIIAVLDGLHDLATGRAS